jgi:hypothetical protein
MQNETPLPTPETVELYGDPATRRWLLALQCLYGLDYVTWLTMHGMTQQGHPAPAH